MSNASNTMTESSLPTIPRLASSTEQQKRERSGRPFGRGNGRLAWTKIARRLGDLGVVTGLPEFDEAMHERWVQQRVELQQPSILPVVGKVESRLGDPFDVRDDPLAR